MHRPLRIAVLECDTPPEKINLKYDGYYGVFSRLLRRSAETLQHEQLNPDSGLEISRWDVVTEQAYPQLESVDGIVLTGSSKACLYHLAVEYLILNLTIEHNAFEDAPWILKLVEFTKRAIQDPRVKLLGVCFGHQIIARALGVQVSRSAAGWEISVCEVNLTPAGKELFGLDTLVCFCLLWYLQV
jgi:GMP synthase-like glutamine amidotransferase